MAFPPLHMEKLTGTAIPAAFVLLTWMLQVNAQAPDIPDFHIDRNGISEDVLKNYLARAVTMAELLCPDPYYIDGPYPDKADDIRLIKNLRPKFVGRAFYRWGGEAAFREPAFLKQTKALVEEIHRFDQDIIFQGAIFETVSTQVNEVPVPAWVFRELGLRVEDRNFVYEDMKNKDGIFAEHWNEHSSVPDITRRETQLWFIFLAGTFFDIGIEAIHLGQVDLIGMADHQYKAWNLFLDKIRRLARKRARRNWVLLDAHTPEGGMVANGKSLLDFNSFPLRIKEIPEKPMEGKLETGYLDAFFGRSKGCVTPSGWNSPSLPYLVEFDNFGRSASPGKPSPDTHYIWGYDEITWFYLQPAPYRNAWLQYAYDWIKKHDKAGYLQMPISRVITPLKGGNRYRANTQSPSCKTGQSQEETIKAIWESGGG